jgi:hypothetical protein
VDLDKAEVTLSLINGLCAAGSVATAGVQKQ